MRFATGRSARMTMVEVRLVHYIKLGGGECGSKSSA